MIELLAVHGVSSFMCNTSPLLNQLIMDKMPLSRVVGASTEEGADGINESYAYWTVHHLDI